jgi:type II secretory pathway pseudopilin PulG
MIHHSQTNTSLGFTLIETIIYIALFSILIGGGVTTAYSLIESSDRNQTETLLTDESLFIFSKIRWIISQTDTIQNPPINTLGQSLTVIPWNRDIGNTVTIAFTGTNITLQKDTDSEIILNDSRVLVSHVQITHALPIGTNTEPEFIETTYTLSARTKEGSTISHQFSDRIYINK